MTAPRILFATAVAACVASSTWAATTPSTPRNATPPPARDGWCIGLGLGVGSAQREFAEGSSTDRESSASGNLRLGIPVRRTVHLAIESNGWRKSAGGESVLYNTVTGGVAWFPAAGLVVRAGAGWGVTTETLAFEGGKLVSSDTGAGLSAALGYEFRLTRTFALGPQLDVNWISVGEGHATWSSLGLQANWYFVPRF